MPQPCFLPAFHLQHGRNQARQSRQHDLDIAHLSHKGSVESSTQLLAQQGAYVPVSAWQRVHCDACWGPWKALLGSAAYALLRCSETQTDRSASHDPVGRRASSEGERQRGEDRIHRLETLPKQHLSF